MPVIGADPGRCQDVAVNRIGERLRQRAVRGVGGGFEPVEIVVGVAPGLAGLGRGDRGDLAGSIARIGP